MAEKMVNVKLQTYNLSVEVKLKDGDQIYAVGALASPVSFYVNGNRIDLKRVKKVK